MMIWHVSSGDLRAKVETDDRFEACKLAVKSYRPERLGRIFRVSSKGFSDEEDGNPWYVLTEVVLEQIEEECAARARAG